MRRLIAAGFGGLLIAGVLAACGQSATATATAKSGPSAKRIPLVPSAASAGGSWDWSAACPVAPRSPSGCAAAGPMLGPAQLAGDEWNLGGASTATGSVNMSVGADGALAVRGNLSDAPPCTATNCLATQANTWVRGYPSVLYGIDQCHAATSPAQSSKLRLPARLDSIPSDLVGRASYDAQAAEVTYNVSYDLWLSPSDTTTPCQTDGTLEVMIWTDYGAKALLPDSLIVGAVKVPYSVDGVVRSADQSWMTVYVSNVHGDGHTVPWGGTIWLIPSAANTTRQGTVAVDLSSALSEVGSLLEHNYGWPSLGSSHWLDTIAFGMEYGPLGGDPYAGGPADFAWDLSSYCLLVGTTTATVPAC